MFYYPDNKIVDHSRMPALMLRRGQFAEVAKRLRAEFQDRAEFVFASTDLLHESSRRMHEDSGIVDKGNTRPQLPHF
jgi:hypothetical protein